MSNLTTVEMIEASETFVDSLTHVLGNYLPESKIAIQTFIAEILLKEKPYMLVSPEGIARIQQQVFASEVHRDFIFTLHFTFFSRWGHTDSSVAGLIGNIARGVAMSNVMDGNEMPAPIRSRLHTFASAERILLANQWLVIVLMLQLLVVADLPVLKQKQPKVAA